MRALIVAFACLLAACCASLPDQAASSKPQVLRIQFGEGTCTGVAIGPNAVLTAAHCFDGATVGALRINGEPAGFAVAADDGFDHLILRVSTRLLAYADLAPAPPAGTRVYLWGNPLGLKGVLRVGRIAGDVDHFNCPGRPPGPCSMLLIDINATYGDSGAAIFDEKGRVVAIQSGGISARGWVMPYVYRFNFTTAQLAAARL